MRRRRARQRTVVWALRIVLFGSLLLLWDSVVRSGRVSPLLLPEPLAVGRRLVEVFGSSTLWDNLWVTVYCIVIASVLAVVAGVGIGVVVGSSRYWSRVLEPLVIAVYTVPIIVILPVITLLFGIGDFSKIIFAGFYGFLPILASTIKGVQVVPKNLVDAARALGASSRQLRWRIQIPAARSMILSGVRIGMSLALIGVIAAQMLASTNGIGFLISTNAQLLNSKDLYAYILLTFALAGIVNYLLVSQEQAAPGRRSALGRTVRKALGRSPILSSPEPPQINERSTQP